MQKLQNEKNCLQLQGSNRRPSADGVFTETAKIQMRYGCVRWNLDFDRYTTLILVDGTSQMSGSR